MIRILEIMLIRKESTHHEERQYYEKESFHLQLIGILLRKKKKGKETFADHL